MNRRNFLTLAGVMLVGRRILAKHSIPYRATASKMFADGVEAFKNSIPPYKPKPLILIITTADGNGDRVYQRWIGVDITSEWKSSAKGPWRAIEYRREKNNEN